MFRPGLFALFGASALLLFIACINVANLLLARASARRREVALRAAIGASRGRLVRLFLTESLVLAVAGAIVGVARRGAEREGRSLPASPIRIPRADAIGVDCPVLIFATIIAAVTALAFGLVPAFIMSRAELQDALKDGSKGSGAQGRTMRSSLVVAEVALAVILLSGAGLLVRSVSRMLRVNTGVDPAFVITVDMQLPDAAYREWERVDQFYASLTRALAAATGESSRRGRRRSCRSIPAGGCRITSSAPNDLSARRRADRRSFIRRTPATLRRSARPIIRGRTFDSHDDASARPVVIVNETLAKRLWPNEDPIGQAHQHDDPPDRSARATHGPRRRARGRRRRARHPEHVAPR